MHRGVELTEMDTDAVLARHPQVALVDELAHTNAPGSRHEKRWQDVQQLLDAGIDVITTVNIQHLESLNDVVAAITGIKQTETVPDEVVRAAEQIELVDMTPQALRRRMAHGHIYPAERIDTALGNYFREGNLTALRELALLWVADRVEEGLDRYRAEHGINGTWAARDRIVVALTGGPEGKTLLRRGARIAGRVAGRTLIAVHVVRSDATVGTSATEIERQRLLAENLGGSLQLIVGDDIAGDRAGIRPIGERHPDHRRRTPARPPRATGPAQHRQRHRRRLRRHRRARRHPPQGRADPLRPRPDRAASAAAGGLDRRGRHSLRAGGRTAALAGRAGAEHRAADLPARRHRQRPDRRRGAGRGRRGDRRAAGQLPLHPAHRLVDHHRNPSNVFALVVFIVVGVTVASIVDRSAIRARQAVQGKAEAQLVAAAATSAVNSPNPVHAVLQQARIGFAMTSVALLAKDPTAPNTYQLIGAAGTPPSHHRVTPDAQRAVTRPCPPNSGTP